MVESLMKNKAVGVFIFLWGVAFAFYGAAELADYYYTGWKSTALLETGLWLIVDVAYILAGITLWVIATKILTARS